MKPIDAASELCTLVFAGDLPLLKRYISAGIEVLWLLRSARVFLLA
jgi:hypothetical protein